jgi:hypothetical protein
VNSHAKERLLKPINKLLAEGEAVLQTKFSRSGGSYVDFGDPWVEAQVFQKWVTSCRNLVRQIGKSARVWVEAFDGKFSNQHVTAKSLMGSLQSLREAVQDDMLNRVEDLVTADAFGSLLEQADALLAKGYVIAAGVLCRAVLEEHLRLHCNRQNCLPDGRPTINDLNQALYKQGFLDKLAMQSVTAMATAGNHCAHNEQPSLQKEDVEKLHRDVNEFLVRHPLGYPKSHDKNKKRNGFVEKMPSATELTKRMLHDEWSYRMLSAVAHGHSWAIRGLGWASFGPDVVVNGVPLRQFEKTVNPDAIAVMGLSATKALCRPLWNQCRYFGWHAEQFKTLFENVFDELGTNDNQRFWRT